MKNEWEEDLKRGVFNRETVNIRWAWRDRVQTRADGFCLGQ